MRNTHIYILLFAAVGLSAGCRTTKAQLQPISQPGSQPGVAASQATAAVSQIVNGVEVTVSVEAWDGVTPIELQVTPVRVRMKNTSKVPVRVDFPQFAITELSEARDFRSYRAIAPYRVRDPFSVGFVGGGSFNPIWFGRGFRVYQPFLLYAPYGQLAYGQPYTWTPTYWNYCRSYWRNHRSPTNEMIARALPPGALDPGGQIEGWLYFERVKPEGQLVEFEAQLLADDEKEIGKVRIPFRVVEQDK